MDPPEDLTFVRAMSSLPDPPTASESRQVYWWRAYYDGTTYRIENGQGKMLAKDRDWAKLCADLGWYPGHVRAPAPAPTRRAVRPAMCDDELDEIRARGELVVGLHKPKHPLEQRPEPPDEGQSVEILGYRVTRRTLSGKTAPRTYYYAYDSAGEIVSFADNWIDWCHQMNWFPRDDLNAGQAIPREAKAESPRPKARTAPVVLNRHHYKTRDEIPEPWIYMGRGHALGNPFVVVKDDPQIRSTLADDPNNPEHRSELDALTRYRRWLWEKIRRRDPEVLRELGKITPETHLVCSCAPRPCHLDVVVRAWKWARGRTVLDGYGAEDEPTPDWASDPQTQPAEAVTTPAAPPASAPASAPATPAEPDRPKPENLDLFGGSL